MKAFLQIESNESKLQYQLKQLRKKVYQTAPSLARQINAPGPSGWVAEITGLDPTYKFHRRFLKGYKSYENANALGTKGVVVEYIIESGKLYDVKDGCGRRYYCTVSNDGDVVTVSESYVLEMIEQAV